MIHFPTVLLKFRYQSKVVTLILALLFSLAYQMHTAPSAYAYNCGTISSGTRCYSIIEWQGSVTGAFTQNFTNQIYGGNCLVNNELWLIDGNTSDFLEAGVKSETGQYSGNEVFFTAWYDGIFDRSLGPQLSSSDFGTFTSDNISHVASDDTWNFYSIVPGTGNGNATDVQFASDTDYQPNIIEEGLEMCGTSGQDAPHNGFAYNQWYSGSNADNNHFQDRYPDDTVINSPASGVWTSPPNNGTGGSWSTCISGAGC